MQNQSSDNKLQGSTSRSLRATTSRVYFAADSTDQSNQAATQHPIVKSRRMSTVSFDMSSLANDEEDLAANIIEIRVDEPIDSVPNTNMQNDDPHPPQLRKHPAPAVDDSDSSQSDEEAGSNLPTPLPAQNTPLDKKILALRQSGLSIAQSAKSGNSSLSMKGNAILYLWRVYITPWIKFYSAILRRYMKTSFGLLHVPVLAAMFTCGMNIVLLQLSSSIVLPQLDIYNLFHILYFVLCEICVLTCFWASQQISRYQTAWRLAHSSLINREIFSASRGKYGELGRFLFLLLWLFRIGMFVVTFFAEWLPSDSILGANTCFYPRYTQESVGSYSVDPAFINGDIDFAEVYMYGLPLMNGIIAGFGPWPTWAPRQVFRLSGPGPAFVVRVNCNDELRPWTGANKTVEGSGSFLSSLFIGKRSINAALTVILPKSGFDNLNVTTDWVSQECFFDGYMARAIWDFQYSVDEWQMVTAGKATAFSYGNMSLQKYSTDHIAADYVVSILKNASSYPEQYDFSTPSSEGAILIDALVRALQATMDNQWYAPTQGGTFSNFMSWATQPDGYYYPEYTARGISAALGAVFHQVFLQYPAETPDMCNYQGQAGAGTMDLNPTLIWALTIILGVISLLYMLQGLFTWLMYPVKNALAFEHAASVILFETERMFYGHSLMHGMQQKNYMKATLLEQFGDMKVKFGERRETMSERFGTLWIGPTSETVKVRTDRNYRFHAVKTDKIT